MKGEIIIFIIGTLRTSVLLVIAGVVFYCVYPKYTFTYMKDSYVKQNTVTGKIEYSNIEPKDIDWKKVQEHEDTYMKEHGFRK